MQSHSRGWSGWGGGGGKGPRLNMPFPSGARGARRPRAAHAPCVRCCDKGGQADGKSVVGFCFWWTGACAHPVSDTRDRERDVKTKIKRYKKSLFFLNLNLVHGTPHALLPISLLVTRASQAQCRDIQTRRFVSDCLHDGLSLSSGGGCLCMN